MSLRPSKKWLDPWLNAMVTAEMIGFIFTPALVFARGDDGVNRVHRAANAILQHCRSDGAITQEGADAAAASSLHIVPYCANLTAIGLEIAISRRFGAYLSWLGWTE